MTTGPNEQVHYNAVRRALENGNAAVMVGAGFSKNAENGDELAMWSDVAQELWSELNPDAAELLDFSASKVTQLGEQYARVFSKPALEELLKRMIPDERVAPGVLHRSLLSLPWSEIFTTNYDTLLERAAEAIVDKAHFTVMCREDIPQSKILGRRRIVKLHGSFPSQRPFIFTEEDYRRYPDKSAPFINLVRQSMLENVFCLIGFSGEDPNFLHWIGWVRDMLDEHALPIYLFVPRAPSLGIQKLLESRRVTAVVLPTKPGVEEWDYGARFAVLFETLKKPLTASTDDWGKRPVELQPILRGPLTSEQRREQIVTAFSSMRKTRKSYPGWFVMPYLNRKRFASNVEDVHSLLSLSQIQKQLHAEAPHVGIVILAEYIWHQDVLLKCLDDELANLALQLLELTAPQSNNVAAAEAADLKKLEAESPQEFQQCWKEVGLGTLRWAREALRQNEFDVTRELLLRLFSTDLHVADQIMYEEILLKLYSGDRDQAQKLLTGWDIRSPDSYMLVRKGMLLGELGEVTQGLKIALVGLKNIRKNQRSRSNSTLYLSQEAWACLAIGYLQDSLDVTLGGNASVESLEYLPDEVTQRLTDLAAVGYDVRREVLQLTADLNAETPPPSQTVTYAPLFELGRYSTTRHLGGIYSHRRKVDAAFEWLTLSDRVSLVPRVGNATFDIGSFGQAAWWVQYGDSTQRVLSVIMRLMNSKMLEPRSSSQFIHSAGWLSRYQVAKTPEPLARELIERSMSFVERMVSQELRSEFMERTIRFHLQVSSRLMIRVTTAGFARAQLDRIVEMYSTKQLVLHPELWKEAAHLTAYCFESLSPAERLTVVDQIASIPDRLELNIHDPFRSADWLDLSSLVRRKGDLSMTDPNVKVQEIVDILIDRLMALAPGKTEDSMLFPPATESIWSRLFWIKSWGGISPTQLIAVEGVLLSGKDWPIIPGHHSWAALSWIGKSRKKAAEKRYQQWILEQHLDGFASPSPKGDQSPTRSWALRNANVFLENLRYSVDNSRWTEIDMIAAIRIIKKWWDQEWEIIQPELIRLEQLKEMFIVRMKMIDSIIAAFIDKFSLRVLLTYTEFTEWLEQLRMGSITAGSELFCTNISCAFEAEDRHALAQLENEIILRLFDSDIPGANYIAGVISYWTQHPRSKEHDAPSSLIYSLAGVVSARRMPVLPWALGTLTEISERRPEWITSGCYSLLTVGLKIMISELSYEHRPNGTGIPDDSIPLLRFSCVRLALALKASAFFDAEDACGLWLKEASTDPLPELRFMSS